MARIDSAFVDPGDRVEISGAGAIRIGDWPKCVTIYFNNVAEVVAFARETLKQAEERAKERQV